jgi:hypothetical protein
MLIHFADWFFIIYAICLKHLQRRTEVGTRSSFGVTVKGQTKRWTESTAFSREYKRFMCILDIYYCIHFWFDILSLQVRILEIIFFYGLVGLAARCIMDLVVFRAGFAQVHAAGPA